MAEGMLDAVKASLEKQAHDRGFEEGRKAGFKEGRQRGRLDAIAALVEEMKFGD